MTEDQNVVKLTQRTPPLQEDMDARRWADEFIAVCKMNGWFVGTPEGVMPVEEAHSWMVTWFANAIMCGWDAHGRVPQIECSPETSDKEEAMVVKHQMHGVFVKGRREPVALFVRENDALKWAGANYETYTVSLYSFVTEAQD